MSYARQADALLRHLEIMPFRDALDADLCAGVLGEAARFAAGVLDPLGAGLDRDGARVVDGRVRTAPAHHAAWAQYRDLGWMGMAGDLPLPLLSAVEELFNRASPAFMMLPTATRTAATLLAEAAPEWQERLLTGEWAATICISEPDAGSDVGRIRTHAVRDGDGWRVTGEKCWISFGDHDLAPRIGHMALARSRDVAGVRGLSLFLVPSTRADGAANGVVLRRIEEKLGLHGSPTCQIGFEGAEATLIGEEGRGLQTLFPMMLAMRLSCGPQGTGLAAGALAMAVGYAQERKQGGAPDAPPVPIAAHADVQRQLLAMAARLETTRALTLTAAAALELGASDPAWLDLAQVLLPLVKDAGAWAAFENASGAIQILGGAGFTREWPAERMLRDARVFPLFEGTSGIQAIDLLYRRLRGPGFAAFLAHVRAEAEGAPALAEALVSLEAAAQTLAGSAPRDGEAGAAAFLDLCKLVAQGWMAARLVRLGGDDDTGKALRAAAGFALAELPARAAGLARLAVLGGGVLAGSQDLVAGY